MEEAEPIAMVVRDMDGRLHAGVNWVMQAEEHCLVHGGKLHMSDTVGHPCKSIPMSFYPDLFDPEITVLYIPGLFISAEN